MYYLGLDEIMTIAAKMRNKGLSRSLALRYAWSYARNIFAPDWSEDSVQIIAAKKEGEEVVRYAPIGSLEKRNGTLTYFDSYKGGYRSFQLELVKSVLPIYDEAAEAQQKELDRIKRRLSTNAKGRNIAA